MSIFDEEDVVDNPNSGVVSETTTKTNADGTTETYTKKNATNNPKWRGENQDKDTQEPFSRDEFLTKQEGQSAFDQTTFDQLEQEDAANNYYGSMGDTAELQLDMQQREDPRFFRDPLETTYFDGEPMMGYPNVVNPLGETEPLEISQSDYFDIDPVEDTPASIKQDNSGYGVNTSRVFPDSKLFSELIDDPAYVETLNDDGSSTFNLADGSDIDENKPSQSFEPLTESQMDARQGTIQFIQRLEGLEAQEKDVILEGVSQFIMENPTDAALLGISIVPGLGIATAATIKVGGKVIGTVANITKNSKWGKKIINALFKKDGKSLPGAKNTIEANVGKLTQAETAKATARTAMKKAEDAVKNTKLAPGSKGFKDLQNKLDKAKLNYANKGKAIKKIKQHNKDLVPEKVFSPGKAVSNAALGGYLAKSYFDDEDTLSPQEDYEATARTEEEIKESGALQDALSRIGNDQDGNAIAEAAQRDANVAQMIVDNQGRIQQEYGTGLARDLFTIAVSALAGLDPMSTMGAMGEKLMLDQKQDRDLELQGLKDQTALRKEAMKQQADYQKDTLKSKKDSRDKIEADLTSMITQGGLKGGSLTTRKDGILKMLHLADKMQGVEYDQKPVQIAMTTAVQDILNTKDSWFDSDEDKARANIPGRFLGNMAILSADGGNLSRDGYALKNSTLATNSKYTNWLYTRHSEAERGPVASRKFSEWKEIRETKGKGWYAYNDFPAWAVQNLGL